MEAQQKDMMDRMTALLPTEKQTVRKPFYIFNFVVFVVVGRGSLTTDSSIMIIKIIIPNIFIISIILNSVVVGRVPHDGQRDGL